MSAFESLSATALAAKIGMLTELVVRSLASSGPGKTSEEPSRRGGGLYGAVLAGRLQASKMLGQSVGSPRRRDARCEQRALRNGPELEEHGALEQLARVDPGRERQSTGDADERASAQALVLGGRLSAVGSAGAQPAVDARRDSDSVARSKVGEEVEHLARAAGPRQDVHLLGDVHRLGHERRGHVDPVRRQSGQQREDAQLLGQVVAQRRGFARRRDYPEGRRGDLEVGLMRQLGTPKAAERMQAICPEPQSVIETEHHAPQPMTHSAPNDVPPRA